MSNPILHKSLRLLAHPLALASLLLLLINDHLLRRLWPSWLTGKLGDFAWLFVAPLALAVVLALVLPRRLRERLTAPLSFGLVGSLFVSAKTLPAAHAAVVSVAESVFGFPVGLRRDPTDLLALAGFAAGAALWALTPLVEPHPEGPRRFSRAAGWVALAMAALLTVANSPAPDPGIYCVAAADEKVFAFAVYGGFESTDGGLTWSSSSQQQLDCPTPWGMQDAAQVLEGGAGGRVTYRYAPGRAIEISGDGGQTWQEGYGPATLTEAEQAMVQRRLGGNVSIRATPLDADIDRVTGNAIFALGHSGVLVHTREGGWRTAAVNGYRAPDALAASDLVALLLGEGLLALGVLLLAFVTLVTVAELGRRGWMIFLLAAAWLLWLGIVFFLGPARLSSYGVIIGYGALLVLGVLLVLAVAAAIVRLAGRLRSALLPAFAISTLAALLFLVPYVLWAINTLPSYVLAAAFAAALAVATVVAGGAYLRASHPIPVGGQPRS